MAARGAQRNRSIVLTGRKQLRGILIGLTSCLLCGVVSTSAYASTRSVTLPEQLTLNSNYNWHRYQTPPVRTAAALTPGEYYVATVSGAFSYWPAYLYRPHSGIWQAVCGTPLNSASGPVGMDAQFIFARPWSRRRCERHHLPVAWSGFQAGAASLSNWAHPAILGSVNQPTANHTYSYALLGEGHPAAFRLKDTDTRDNYGKLTITVRLATSSDCSSYQAFGFASSASCLTALSMQ